MIRNVPPPFDVLIAFDAVDRLAARTLGRALQDLGLSVWLDDQFFTDELEPLYSSSIIDANAHRVVVLVGENGIDRWQKNTEGLSGTPIFAPAVADHALQAFLNVHGGKVQPAYPHKSEDAPTLNTSLNPESLVYVARDQQYRLLQALRSSPSSTDGGPRWGKDYLHRVNDVVAFLREQNQLGPLESLTTPYLEATLSVREAFYTPRFVDDNGVVFWAADWVEGATHTRVAIGGWAHHMTREVRTDIVVGSSNATPAIRYLLTNAFSPVSHPDLGGGKFNAQVWEVLRNVGSLYSQRARQPLVRPFTLRDTAFTMGLAFASRDLHAPESNIRCVFRVLGRWRANGITGIDRERYELLPGASDMDLILGAPLFVAEEEDQ